MTADMAAKKFSVWVTPPGGQEIMIAQDYAFRSSALATDDLGKICLMSPLGPNMFKIVSHTPPEAQ
jgi:unsaturated chondroitin disaccharide hydrolase